VSKAERRRVFLLLLLLLLLVAALVVGRLPLRGGPITAPTPTLGPGGGAQPTGPSETPTLTNGQPGTSAGSVSVDARKPMSRVTHQSMGINAAVYDSYMDDPTSVNYYKSANIGTVRYPGGQTGDNYDWRNNRQFVGVNGQPPYQYNAANSFDNFMAALANAHAVPFLTTDYLYGGTPQLTTDWMTYVITKGYTTATDFEVGNELYFHKPSGVSDAAFVDNYANFVITAVTGLRKAYPTSRIKVFVPFDIDHNYAMLDAHGDSTWNGPVVKRLCHYIDGIDAHFYPQGPSTAANPWSESDANLLTTTDRYIPGQMAYIHKIIDTSCPSKSATMRIVIGEMNATSYTPGKIESNLPNALFAADAYLKWMELGVESVQWWTMRNGGQNNGFQGNAANPMFGQYSPGDYGVFSSGSNGEAPIGTLFPPGNGLKMAGYTVGVGGNTISATSSITQVAVHAIKRDDGSLAVLLENRDPRRQYNVTINLTGFTPAATGTLYTLGMNGPNAASGAITTTQVMGLGTSFVQNMQPYSLNTLVMVPPGAPAPTQFPTTVTPTATTTVTPTATTTITPSSTERAAATPGL